MNTQIPHHDVDESQVVGESALQLFDSMDSVEERGEQSAAGVLQMINVHWIKCDGSNWCPFERVNLSGVKTTGVYIIWHGGNPARTVRVGQGDIADRLIAHRSDQAVLNYRVYGLWVTWAAVPAHQLDAVERYLFDLLKPLVGSRFPDVIPLAVNTPFAA